MSLIDPLSCGFVKIGAYNILTNKYNVNKKDFRLEICAF